MAGPLTALRALWNARLTRMPAAGGTVVLTYHGLVRERTDDRLHRNHATIAAFREQLAVLRRYRVIALDELARSLEAGDTEARGTIALTVDDGLRGVQPLAELLLAERWPWTLFVSTGPVERGSTIWTSELALLLLHGRAPRLDAAGGRWELSTRPAREEAFRMVRTTMKSLPAAQRMGELERIRAAFPPGEAASLLERFPEFRALTWSEIRAMHGAGATIASHGVEHELHHARQPADVRAWELSTSREAVEREVGAPCRFFAFPNGDTAPESASEAQRAGYTLAFTTRSGAVSRESPRFGLPRVEAGMSAASLRRGMGDAARPGAARGS